MIRKPESNVFDPSPSIKLMGETAEMAGHAKKVAGKAGRKAGWLGQLVVMGWLSFGTSLGVLDSLSRHTHEMLSLRGALATIVMLAIPGGLIYITLRIWRKGSP